MKLSIYIFQQRVPPTHRRYPVTEMVEERGNAEVDLSASVLQRGPVPSTAVGSQVLLPFGEVIVINFVEVSGANAATVQPHRSGLTIGGGGRSALPSPYFHWQD
ncbi:hypothetical protein, unlikely [Trypanosoma brucei gambiense DAL972]|uniref:Uncharacterized protein n=1 Tax=Trypanosoma brucei gambiense (strain MHOM/CI/86/DAL972) TaxID=679716 RepID=C9ZZR4_TRYB9|nr:hypothetical protein, unlikely [Trypanosoma brucei gambiense DAL972]CBH14913.1 hypothetical protein, unlikely [Trypanosoma brucei gambiense DAL972]|eukprot:XP_011777179.1 hypothetical protein, unlikely [Trypanosoma brucei gambiense DAL972]